MLGNLGNGTSPDAAVPPPDATAAGIFHLSLLGSFSLTAPSGHEVEISSRKNRLLLAMLAAAPGLRMTREALAGVLWAEHGEEQAKNSVRQALAALRRDLKGQEGAVFATLESTVALDPARLVLDTECVAADVALGTRQSLQRAIALWRGPFLADVTVPVTGLEQWLREQREHYASLHIAAMDRLVPLLSGAERIDMARSLIQADSLREASHRHLMEAYLLAGERAQAMRHYEKLKALLAAELGVEPSPETQALRDRIVTATGAAAPASPASPSSRSATPATAAPSEPPPPIAAEQPASPAAAAPRRRLVPALAAAAAAMLLVLLAAAAWHVMETPAAQAGMPTVAVLPFESLSGGKEDARIAEGLTVDTITDLTRFWNLKVMAKDTTDAYRGNPSDIRQLGRELHVSNVVKGTFQREGDHVRVTAQLIDAATGATLWSDRYDRLSGEIFAIQSDVADHIANSLASKEGRVDQAVLAGARRKPPADLGAYELYLLAQETMHSDLSDAHMREGQKLLEQAIAKDPTLARAYVKYAWSYAWRFTLEGGAKELMQQMLKYALRGVELDPADADARSALGFALTMSGDPKQGEVQFDEALRLNPNAFDILATYSCMAHGFGKADRGAESADHAIAINPAFPNWSIPCLRLAFVMVGRYEDVVRIQQRQPEAQWNTDGFVIMAGSLAALGRMDEAHAIVAHGLARFPGLLTTERFALNRGWPPEAARVMSTLMQKAGFPACAEDLANNPAATHLPECVKS